jgi:2-oxoglutarate dehydrogenase E1 component
MQGQGAIIATGAIEYPPEYLAWSGESLSGMGLSKIMRMSCTYDHRVIQGAESGRLLMKIQDLLVGKEHFYDAIFETLGLPEVPIQWARDLSPLIHGTGGGSDGDPGKQVGVLRLINLHRVRGHLIAKLDPLGKQPIYNPELDPATFGLTVWDLDRRFFTGGLGDMERGTLRQILALLRDTYCRYIGVEYMHIQDSDEKAWIQQRIERPKKSAALGVLSRRDILKYLILAESFETYLHSKFVGHKRFGLEGAEVTIPVLARILNEAVMDNVPEAVIGMAHRGRLNVLANIVGKPLAKMLAEFEENKEPLITQGSGDVKYHLGAAGLFFTDEGREILVSLAPNPSHLEWVNPVVEGIVRAKQERRGDAFREQVIPILLHGDGAFAGQGVVWETINLSQLHGYRTGGTIHIIINNQIGFTTTPDEARSSHYATDVAKAVQAPIFHVNGDDPDSAVRAARIAYAYRQRFKKDVVLDILCYRRHGHNEGDEPSYTHPSLYKQIRERRSVATLYSELLAREGVVTEQEIQTLKTQIHGDLDQAYQDSLNEGQRLEPDVLLAVSEEELNEFQPAEDAPLGMPILTEVAQRLGSLPDGFHPHPKLTSMLTKRSQPLSPDSPIDWAHAESLAFATLVYEGTPVRLSGQDSARGTFSQRHLVLTDFETDRETVPLKNIHPDQARFEVFDSSLSEAAVLGFEFGYSLADPLTLVIWEAQFGDFANSAQVIIDNFIVSSEAKWSQPCDLVMLLPHGMEGQGPEHSSARLERFLTLCAEDNIRVCFPSTPAQYFHILRLQMRDVDRIPLIVLTPKSNLRNPRATSTAADLAEGRFHAVLDDPGAKDKSAVTRILICSGKIYYDLLLERENRGASHIALLRLEQLYPYPEKELTDVIQSYMSAQEICWVQEEPQNMGAWRHLNHRFHKGSGLIRKTRYIGRPESASPAAGSRSAHRQEQNALIKAAFD